MVECVRLRVCVYTRKRDLPRRWFGGIRRWSLPFGSAGYVINRSCSKWGGTTKIKNNLEEDVATENTCKEGWLQVQVQIVVVVVVVDK